MPPDPAPAGRAPPLRVARRDDGEAIAALHARSWQAAYRGILSDAYLDGPVLGERRAFWAQRLRHPAPGLIVLVAEGEGGALAGFVCALAGHDAEWGTLVDNLHVDPGLRRSGLGRAMLRGLADRLVLEDGGPVHLFVLSANHDAIAFYARLGGEAVEAMIKTEPDGSAVPVQRIAWPSAAALRAGAA